MQVRGSIPLVWTQKPNLQYNPRPKLQPHLNDQYKVSKKHFRELAEHYEAIHLLNLIDKRGSQKTMGEAYSQLFEAVKNPQLHYTWFDFHHECRGMHYEHLSKCVDEVKDFMAAAGWTRVGIYTQASMLQL